jgi:hypothetical protein
MYTADLQTASIGAKLIDVDNRCIKVNKCGFVWLMAGLQKEERSEENCERAFLGENEGVKLKILVAG